MMLHLDQLSNPAATSLETRLTWARRARITKHDRPPCLFRALSWVSVTLLLSLTKLIKCCDGSWLSSPVVLVCEVSRRWERLVDLPGRRMGSSSSGPRETLGTSGRALAGEHLQKVERAVLLVRRLLRYQRYRRWPRRHG
jgi:hypothetical protein